MPLPKPHSGESQDDFISRCMGDPTAMEDFPDQEQRLAVCFRQWREERSMSGAERKSLRVEIKDAEKGIVEAVFATLEQKDHDDDWTLPGAFGEQNVRVSAYGHTSWRGALPVGRGKIREEGNKAIAELKFFMGTQHGRDHFEVIKEMGDLQEWSYGFDVLERGELTEELRQRGVARVLKKLKVHEVSPVMLAAGVGTQTLAIKEAEAAAKKEAEEAAAKEAEEAAAREAEAAAEAAAKKAELEKLGREIQAEYDKFIRTARRLSV